MAIPKAADVEHVRENAKALDITLSEDDLAELDKAFPRPAENTGVEVL